MPHRSSTRRRAASARISRQVKRSARAKAMRLSATAVWVWNADTNEVFWSREWGRILEMPPGRLLRDTPKRFLSRMRKEDAKLLRSDCRNVALGRKDHVDIAVRLRRLDKTWTWVLLRGWAEDCPGEGRVVRGVAVEVSRLRLDRRFFPASLDDTETTYQSILENSPNNIIRFDRELFPLYMNPAVMNYVPCPPSELGDKRVAEIGTDSSDLEFLQGLVDKVFATGEVVKSRRKVITVYGEIVSEFTLWPEFDSKKRVRSVISLMQDHTAEVAREKEAQTNELRFSSLYELTQMNDASEEEVVRFVVEKIAELTDSPYSHLHVLPGRLGPGGYIVWSKSHMELFEEEDLSRNDPRLISGEFGVWAPITRPILHNEPVTESSNIFFKGKLPVKRFLCVPALEDGRTMCFAAVYNKERDYTEADERQLATFINGAWFLLRRRRYIEELEKAKASSELANKVKDRFLATISHELRTPLNGMLSMLQLLELSDLTSEQMEYARSATSTGQMLLRIISDILDYSRMESGKLELDDNPFDLKESLEASVAIFMADARGKGLDLKLTMIGDFPYMVSGDEARVRQIVFNLVGNAMKFTEKGEIEVFCEARHTGEDMVNIHLSVRDTGIGIPPEVQTKVFNAFMQVDESTTRRHQGSGLGLGIVRHLTKLMGGSLRLSSYPGRGTLVECVLPFREVSQSLLGDEDTALEAVIPECPPLTVLVAEDDAVSRFAMGLFLERLGHRPVCVTNGKEALEALRVYPFSCLISDVLMPEFDGLEVTHHIRKGLVNDFEPSEEVRRMILEKIPAEELPDSLVSVSRELPIVAVSAHAMKGDKEHFLNKGMDHYLSKPIKIRDLATMLLRVHESML